LRKRHPGGEVAPFEARQRTLLQLFPRNDRCFTQIGESHFHIQRVYFFTSLVPVPVFILVGLRCGHSATYETFQRRSQSHKEEFAPLRQVRTIAAGPPARERTFTPNTIDVP